jgi:cystinosin
VLSEYVEDRRAGVVQSVEPNDIAFGVHAVLMSSVCLLQFWLYRAAGFSAMTGLHAYIISVIWVVTAYNLVLVLASVLPFYSPLPYTLSFPASSLGSASSLQSSFSLADYLGYCKAGISFVKYTPQAVLNWRRQSTVGWSIFNILLDLTGGSLSILQQCIDAWNRDDNGVLWGNVPKLVLAIETIAFDGLFIVQHFLLYTDRMDPVRLAAGAGGGDVRKAGDASAGYYEQVHSPINGQRRHDGEDEKKHEGVEDL